MKKSKFRVPAKFWTEERNLTWLLVALILDTFIVDPLVSVFTRRLAVSIINSLGLGWLLDSTPSKKGVMSACSIREHGIRNSHLLKIVTHGNNSLL